MKKVNKRTKASIDRRLLETRAKIKGSNKKQIKKYWESYRNFKFRKLNNDLKTTDFNKFEALRKVYIENKKSGEFKKAYSKKFKTKKGKDSSNLFSYQINKNKINSGNIEKIVESYKQPSVCLLRAIYSIINSYGKTIASNLIYSVRLIDNFDRFTSVGMIQNEIHEALEANLTGNYEIDVEDIDRISIKRIYLDIYTREDEKHINQIIKKS